MVVDFTQFETQAHPFVNVTGFLGFPENLGVATDTIVDDGETMSLFGELDVGGRFIKASDDGFTGGAEGGFGFHID